MAALPNRCALPDRPLQKRDVEARLSASAMLAFLNADVTRRTNEVESKTTPKKSITVIKAIG